ncbi:MAG: hypothetical protein WKF40_08960 [Thermoleophilaceae bacterium]
MYVRDRGRRQGRLEPGPGADRQGQRGHDRRAQPSPLRGRGGGARAQHPVRRRHRAVDPRACRDRARRPGDRRHRRRRGQHPDLPGGQGEVRSRARGGPLQQPAQSAALRAAGGQAGGLGDRPDHAPDRARGAQVRPRAPPGPQGGAARDHRDGGGRGLTGRRRERSVPRPARGLAGDLDPARRRRVRAHRGLGRPGR